VVYSGRRSWRGGEEIPRELWKRGSLERPLWSTSRVLSSKRPRLVFRAVSETIYTCLQEDRLWIADPKAINHIIQKSGYLYAKSSDILERAGLLTDHGIFWAEGEFPIVINSSLLQIRLTIPQAMCTNATGGQCLQRLVPPRSRV